MWKFIIRIMDIVNDYNEYFRNDEGKENWYRDFFNSQPGIDVFNFNYDTTIEQSLVNYEDGYGQVKGDTPLEFAPMKLMQNNDDLPTVNHIHGCIEYYYKDDTNKDLEDTTIHDLYKYSSYEVVRKMMMGRGQSNDVAQTNEEYYAGPILTGLRKTEKLSCIPYGFYHGNLFQSIYNSNALIIIGYSFGDIYINNVIRRMNMLHGSSKRVVVIDKWRQDIIDSECNGLTKYLEANVSGEEIEFLEMMSGCTDIFKMIQDFIDKDVTKPKFSSNKCVMLFTNGFKDASLNHKEEILHFIDS